MGSKTDLQLMSEAADILEELKVPYELTIISAHRAPDILFRYAQSAADRGLKVIVAGAGGAAHLPGVTAALTTLPVIGVPVRLAHDALDGWDSILSILQMPAGVPVATVALNGAKNAGILAAQIIGTFDKKVAGNLKRYKSSLRRKVKEYVTEIQRKGFRRLLREK